jgi:biotin carboxyl carrier protein
VATIKVTAEVSGNIWKVIAKDVSTVAAGDVLVIIESMKMEIPVEAPRAGRCLLRVTEGQSVQEGDVLAVIE